MSDGFATEYKTHLSLSPPFVKGDTGRFYIAQEIPPFPPLRKGGYVMADFCGSHNE